MSDELAAALAEADEVVIADIWAGRDPDQTISSAAVLAERVTALNGRPVSAPGSPEATADELASRVRAGDVVLVLGGGRSYVIADRLVSLLAESADG
jgi:UDP-N-acetylmuramate--alanine ligase